MSGTSAEAGSQQEQEEEENEDEIQPEVEIDQELDRELENKSRQHNLTSANVRSIIHVSAVYKRENVQIGRASCRERVSTPV